MSSWTDCSGGDKMSEYEFNVPDSLEQWLKDPKAKTIRAYSVQDEELRHYDPLDTSKYDGWEGDLVNQYD